jgi:adenylosuccinate lyase
VKVEVEWLIFLCNDLKLPGTRTLKKEEIVSLQLLFVDFDLKSALKIKGIEKTTNHDVKAVEYFLRDALEQHGMTELTSFLHFACTSEDINNLSYAMMVRDFGEAVFYPAMEELEGKILSMAKSLAGVAMLARTHGQPASPTTMGKELLNVVERLRLQTTNLKRVKILGKINGATGNFNAHVAAYPSVDWKNASQKFVQKLGLESNFYTTQIEPHDFLAEIFDGVRRVNTILIDFSRDIWMYISLGYFIQSVVKGEVGSSTMPHKVNPIDFENAEGNFGLANALFGHFSEKLPLSRMQRDLTDSTVLRSIGVAAGYSVVGYKSLLRGLNKLSAHEEKMKDDLSEHWEILGEAVQTVLRKYNFPNAYEKLKELTRGKVVTQESYQKFVQSLAASGDKKSTGLPQKEVDALLKLTPWTYIGLAEKMVAQYQ